MDARLLEILVCPLCKGPLKYDRAAQELICSVDKLAYPIQDGIPVMLADEARTTVDGHRVDPAGPVTAASTAAAVTPSAPATPTSPGAPPSAKP